jgi:hypothetical protein
MTEEVRLAIIVPSIKRWSRTSTEDRAGTDAGAIAAGEALRAAASDDGRKAQLGALGGEIRAGSADDARQRRRDPGSAHRVVRCVPAPGRRPIPSKSAANNTHRGLLSAQAASLRGMAFRRDRLRVLAQGSGPQLVACMRWISEGELRVSITRLRRWLDPADAS